MGDLDPVQLWNNFPEMADGAFEAWLAAQGLDLDDEPDSTRSARSSSIASINSINSASVSGSPEHLLGVSPRIGGVSAHTLKASLYESQINLESLKADYTALKQLHAKTAETQAEITKSHDHAMAAKEHAAQERETAHRSELAELQARCEALTSENGFLSCLHEEVMAELEAVTTQCHDLESTCIKTLTQAHTEEMTRVMEARASEIAELNRVHSAALEAREAAVEASARQHEMATMAGQGNTTIDNGRGDASEMATLKAAVKAAAGSMKKTVKCHKEETQALENRHKAATKEAAKGHREEMQKAAAQHKAALKAVTQRCEAEMKEKEEANAARVAEMICKHGEAIVSMEAGHNAEMKAATLQLEELAATVEANATPTKVQPDHDLVNSMMRQDEESSPSKKSHSGHGSPPLPKAADIESPRKSIQQLKDGPHLPLRTSCGPIAACEGGAMRNLVRALGLAVLPWPAFLYSIQDPGTTQLTVALLLLIVSLLIIVHSAKAAQCVLCQSFYADTMCISADGEQGFPQRSTKPKKS